MLFPAEARLGVFLPWLYETLGVNQLFYLFSSVIRFQPWQERRFPLGNVLKKYLGNKLASVGWAGKELQNVKVVEYFLL